VRSESAADKAQWHPPTIAAVRIRGTRPTHDLPRFPTAWMLRTTLLCAAALGTVQAQRCPMGNNPSTTQVFQYMGKVGKVCCNDGQGPGGPGGHRRQLQSQCKLNRCTPACAKLFVPMWHSCQRQASEELSTMLGGKKFYTTCRKSSGGGGGKKTNVYVINKQGQCGQATFPAKWRNPALAWLRNQGLKARFGTCRSAGYTMKVGVKPVPLSGAPVGSINVLLYAKRGGPSKSNAKCVSAKTCEQLKKAYGGWTYGGQMSQLACGESDNGFPKGLAIGHSNKNTCWGDNDAASDGWTHANGICSEVGARLCTGTELKAGVSFHSGCGHDAARIWSADTCKSGATTGHMSFVGNGKKPLCSPDFTNNAVRCCADTAAARAVALEADKKMCDKYGSEEGTCTSSLTCKQLTQKSGKGSWPTKYGDKNICGESDNGFGRHNAKQCFGGQRGEAPIGHRIAEAICTTTGARLCTVEEVKADEARGTGCSHDGRLVWTSDDTGCKPGEHVAWPGSSYYAKKVKGTCISDSKSGPGWKGAAVRCCADTVVGTPCAKVNAPIPPPPPTPGGKNMNVYVINKQGQCGQATFPAKWRNPALAWLRNQGLTARSGTCQSKGYTKKVGIKPVPLSGAPVGSINVLLYAKNGGGGGATEGKACGGFKSLPCPRGYTCKHQMVGDEQDINGKCHKQSGGAGKVCGGFKNIQCPRGYACQTTRYDLPGKCQKQGGGGGGKNMNVYVINKQGQCGQATFPATWKRPALAWLKNQGLTARSGTCQSKGFTKKVGIKPVPLSGAPVGSINVLLYAKKENGGGWVTPVVTQQATSAPGHITLIASLHLLSGAKNVYTLFGDSNSAMVIPPAFQTHSTQSALNADIAGLDPMFFQYDKSHTAQFDSWLTIGITKGDSKGAISMVGIKFDKWSESAGLKIDNGAIFYMSPDKGPTTAIVEIAQLTMTAAAAQRATMKVGVQGRANTGPDYHATVDFSSALRSAGNHKGR
jgi:hypothetical protein